MTTDQRITQAWEALQQARAAANRSPCADTIATESLAEAILNDLLDARHQATVNA